MEIETLKVSHVKRNIIIGIIVVFIISAIVLNFTRAKYRVTDSIEIVNGTVNYTPYDFKVIAMYQEQDGEYVEIDSMPISGYTINEEMSYCTLDNVNHDNEAILYTNADGEHVISGLKKNSKCYLYFDEGPLSVIDVIEDAYNNNPTMLAYDNTVDNNLRYIGSNPNNYVYFNCDDYDNPSSNTCELWRIIGVMNNMETASGTTESLVKLIRNDSIGNYRWDDENVNDWSTSSLQESLNNSYLQGTDLGSGKGITETTRNMIEEVTWKLGGTANYTGSSNGLASHFYGYERGTTVYSGRPTEWRGKIGLMYPSDYGYATSGGSSTDRATCLATELYNWDSSSFSDCKYNDWLFNSATQWTLSPTSSRSYFVFAVIGTGSVSNYYLANDSNGVRPSVYLTSNVKISGGDGTRNNAYIVT